MIKIANSNEVKEAKANADSTACYAKLMAVKRIKLETILIDLVCVLN